MRVVVVLHDYLFELPLPIEGPAAAAASQPPAGYGETKLNQRKDMAYNRDGTHTDTHTHTHTHTAAAHTHTHTRSYTQIESIRFGMTICKMRSADGDLNKRLFCIVETAFLIPICPTSI